MDEILRRLDNYVRNKMKDIRPKFVSIVITVDERDLVDLMDEYPKHVRGNSVEFILGLDRWPRTTIVTFTDTDAEEDTE